MAGLRYKGHIYAGVASYGNANEVNYDNTDSGLTATNVQEALNEVSANIDDLGAADITYDNTNSGLTTTNVQDAVDKLSTLQYFSGSNEKCSWWGYKQNRIIFLRVDGISSYNTYTKDAWNVLFTLPSEYRPVEIVNIVAANNSYYSSADVKGIVVDVRIRGDGEVCMWPFVASIVVPMFYVTYLSSS